MEVGGQTVSNEPTSRTTNQSDRVEITSSTLPQQCSQVQLKHKKENRPLDLMQIIEDGGQVEIPMPARFNQASRVLNAAD